MGVVLGPNQYGKAEVRLVRVTRDGARHDLQDLTVTTQLRGGQEPAHVHGDNAHVVPTDTQKNTAYAFARQHGVASPEAFALLLGRHFTRSFPWVEGGRFAVEQAPWRHIEVDGSEHDHAFVRGGDCVRTAVVTLDGDDAWVVAGLRDLVVLKTTGSEFWGYPKDRYTTLPETRDRVLATSVTARWRYARPDVDFDACWSSVRDVLLQSFARTHSLALQQTLYRMGSDVLEQHPDVAEVRMSMPNRHHLLVDLEPFGLDNPGLVYEAPDRPYGLIEASVLRDDAPPPGRAWESVPGFC